jgi:membrane protein required for colicin V production
MNFLDALIIAPLLWGAYKGFQKGLIFEIAMILGLIAGVYLGFKFSGLVYQLLQKVVSDEGQLLNYLSFFIVFGAIILIFIFYAKLMEAVLKITSLNLFNKIAGAVFGILKFALAISVIFWLLKPMQESVNVIPEKSRKESILYDYVLKIASSLAPAVKDVKDEFRENFGSKSF